MHARFPSLTKGGSMPNIVAGSFEDQDLANRAAEALRAAGFTAAAIMTFALNARRRRSHPALPEPVDVATGVVGGAKRRAVGRGLNFEADRADEPPPPPERTSGVMLAVHAPEPDAQERALRILVTEGARDLETADGTWCEGCWTDFDSIGPGRPVDQVHPQGRRSHR